MANFNVRKLDKELKAAGLPIAGCSSSGRVDWLGVPTQADLDLAESVKAAHNPAPDPEPVKPEAAIAAIKGGSLNPVDLSAYARWLIETRGD